MNDDLINRRDAISAFWELNISLRPSAIDAIINMLRTVPSANLQPTCNLASNDCISRQAAIEAICTEGTRLERNGTVAMVEIKQWCVDILEALPSAQPEPCEDTVPRTSVEYICRKNTVSTNPYEHKYHDKFIQFMDDPEISDFGRWQHSNGFNTALVAVKCDLDKVPSAQPERLTDDDFETIRIHLSAYKERLCNQHRWEEAEEYQRIIDRFMSFASAQPDIDEWCHDCKEYDKERHCCPRWNRVIRQTLKDAQPDIIHCGECKHRDPEDHKCDCGHDILWQLPRDDEWYCADAERKEGEADDS